ncbi:30S ribosomal protein S14 [Bifidobacterium subtile]
MRSRVNVSAHNAPAISHHQAILRNPSMAKTSKIYRERQRKETVAKYAERRAEYKRDSVNPHLSAEEREEAMRKLHALPRNASPVRLRNRDSIDGRPRAFNRKFGLSRINLREKAHRGELPGVTKSSW